MGETVLVPIPLSADLAATLADERARVDAGAELERLLRLRQSGDPLGMIIRDIQQHVVDAGGITDEELEAELAAHKAERRR